MVSPPLPPIPAPCFRFTWHCDNCHGDSVFDIHEVNRASAEKARCLGCGHVLAFYFDEGIFQRHFRPQDSAIWEKK